MKGRFWSICFDAKGRVVPKSVLEEKLYGIDSELESNAVPVHVHHLRRKLLEARSERGNSYRARHWLFARRDKSMSFGWLSLVASAPRSAACDLVCRRGCDRGRHLCVPSLRNGGVVE